MPSTTLHTENTFNSVLPSVNVFDIDSLIAETFQPLNWAVNGLLPEGCVLFAGRPKLGKSWLVLQLALAVASGGKALGSIPAEQGDVLYLALEDTKRRLQSRVKTLLRSSPVPEVSVCQGTPLPQIFVSFRLRNNSGRCSVPGLSGIEPRRFPNVPPRPGRLS